MKTMEINDGKWVIAVTTDNPTVTQAFRRKFQESYFWVLTFLCFLHSLNTLIGKICSFPLMKQIVSKSMHIVNSFNSSHYWGGQLNGEAKKQGINRKMKQNCESRFYALVLQSMSVLAYRTNNQTPVALVVVATVLHDVWYWKLLNQLMKTVKFLMSQLTLDAEDNNTGFWMHAKSVFNHRFHAINTDLHSLALFLHPICRKLTVTDASKGRPFKFMVKTALAVAKQWRWGEQKAKLLVDDLKAYNLCCAPFSGGQADGLAWWESLTVCGNRHPLKALAITLLSIVPHAADVKHLFLDMGSTQSPKRCNLTVDTFEALAKIQANLHYHSHQKALANGRPICRRHAHMHTSAQPGINIDVAADLEANFAWAPPLAPQTQNIDDDLAGPESISLDEIKTAFALLEHKKEVMERVLEDGNEHLLLAVLWITKSH
ncbi:hypothetical protein DFJ58DRAFT_853521 [Suillus subalutaceus]|uniref:uncharacterized protein n=1 Tax=Suillus subalutaceus TaxID=48586 RepID=UPI001B882C74|nr:uncharacterized protein DFJ58DRAFT_853521 [Suillus subalutaceus]KAG1843774.1 hypothetical protein DFJ58DRAFT_853521 [Suillus subalutaceus]